MKFIFLSGTRPLSTRYTENGGWDGIASRVSIQSCFNELSGNPAPDEAVHN